MPTICVHVIDGRKPKRIMRFASCGGQACDARSLDEMRIGAHCIIGLAAERCLEPMDPSPSAATLSSKVARFDEDREGAGSQTGH